MEDKIKEAKEAYDFLSNPEKTEKIIEEKKKEAEREIDSLKRTLESDYLPSSFDSYREFLEKGGEITATTATMVGYSKLYESGYERINWE